MSHPEQLAFFALCADANTDFIPTAKVFEVGSYDVNGSVRALFAGAADYCGVDLASGPGVDRVAFGHEVSDPDGSWDISLSSECFEHDDRWTETLENMVRLTRPGGLVAFSCASRGRVEHGTSRTTTIDSPGTQFEGLDHYRNVRVADVADLPLGEWFSQYRIWYNRTSADLYFAGLRAGHPGAATSQAGLPDDEAVAGLSTLMPFRLRLVRLPLRAIMAVTEGERDFQRLAVPYWRVMTRSVAFKDRLMAKVRGRLRRGATAR
jgi:SAM-dependent methyltransferase